MIITAFLYSCDDEDNGKMMTDDSYVITESVTTGEKRKYDQVFNSTITNLKRLYQQTFIFNYVK